MTSPKTCWRQTIHMVQCKTRHRGSNTYEHHGEFLHIQSQQTKPTPQRQPRHHQQPSFGHSNHTKLKHNTKLRKRLPNRRHYPVHTAHPQMSVTNHVSTFDSNLKMGHIRVETCRTDVQINQYLFYLIVIDNSLHIMKNVFKVSYFVYYRVSNVFKFINAFCSIY